MASVASFFVSRIDGLVDPLLDKIIAQGGEKTDAREDTTRASGHRQLEDGLSDL